MPAECALFCRKTNCLRTSKSACKALNSVFPARAQLYPMRSRYWIAVSVSTNGLLSRQSISSMSMSAHAFCTRQHNSQGRLRMSHAPLLHYRFDRDFKNTMSKKWQQWPGCMIESAGSREDTLDRVLSTKIDAFVLLRRDGFTNSGIHLDDSGRD